ncbi:TadE-like protein [Shimia gijangensis]|uniref:TadE-like protein n=1 Tax=Shimia gijangensis TaxID=1470563 RepID=A0A1M6IYK1_9RHOB|nr:TadE/TadG family type IV pilus assembly protein [Shimia gijangensis]SHJ39519.1 TadE-like protein [Shimia gijangensis]
MKTTIKHWLKSLRKSETGNATIEFVILFPVFIFIMLSSIELGVFTIKSALVERALDVVVRDVRLSTGNSPTHEELKTMICDETGAIPGCQNNIAIELYNIDPRAWYDIAETTTCTNRAEEVDPVTTFHNGMDNDLMVVRICAKYETLFENIGMSSLMQRDSSGDVAIVAISAFVQEPS